MGTYAEWDQNECRYRFGYENQRNETRDEDHTKDVWKILSGNGKKGTKGTRLKWLILMAYGKREINRFY